MPIIGKSSTSKGSSTSTLPKVSEGNIVYFSKKQFSNKFDFHSIQIVDKCGILAPLGPKALGSATVVAVSNALQSNLLSNHFASSCCSSRISIDSLLLGSPNWYQTQSIVTRYTNRIAWTTSTSIKKRSFHKLSVFCLKRPITICLMDLCRYQNICFATECFVSWINLFIIQTMDICLAKQMILDILMFENCTRMKSSDEIKNFEAK